MMDEIEHLLALLVHPDLNVRWKAVVAAGHEHDPRMIEALLDRLDDPAPEVRAQAAQAMYWLYDQQQRIAPALIPLLTDRVPEVRAAAVRGLGSRYYREALEPLIDRLRDDEPEVRAAAAQSLSSYTSYRTVRYLIRALEDEAAEVRKAAAGSLINLDHRDALQPLLKMALDAEEDSGVREHAIEALGYLTHKGNIRPIDLILEERDVVGQLLTLLNDADEELCHAAIDALERIGDGRAITPLVAMLCNWDEDFGRRLWALVALGALKDLRVTPILIATLEDPEPMLRPWAASALGELSDPAALPALDRLAADESDKLGEAATKAAVKIRYECSWQEFEQVAKYLFSEEHSEQQRALDLLSTWPEPEAMDLILKALGVALERNDLLLCMRVAKIVANAGEARALPLLAQAAEYWQKVEVAGAVEECENAALYIRRKLNGEKSEPFVSLIDDEEYELDDLEEDGDDLTYGSW